MTSIAAIVCAHTLDRWSDIENALESLRNQTRPADEIILAVDHNPELAEQAASAFGSTVKVVENAGPRGVSGARNAAAEQTTVDVLAYLDDDAVADSRWIERLMVWFEDPQVVGVGGTAHPAWDGGPGPAWFPASFNWVIGCSHSGIADTPEPVRNFIGCNMSIRRSAWKQVGGFYSGLGRVGANAGGGDETDFCIRVTQDVGGVIMNDPAAVVHHRVPADRQTLAYFVRRCRSEGRSKAHLTERAGADTALSEERNHLLKTLPRDFVRGFADLGRGDLNGVSRSAAIVAGTAATGLGYIEGRLKGPADSDAASVASPDTQGFAPVRVVTIDIDDQADVNDALTTPVDQGLFALVRRGAQPLGVLQFTSPPSADDLSGRLGQFREAAHAAAATPSQSDRTASVVIATRDRTESLERCLRSVMAMTVSADQVIVVDSAPSDDDTKNMIARWNVTESMPVDYVRADQPGLATAHNAALPALTCDVVAFTDDDVIVDQHWLAELLSGFDDANEVACVTGGIMPAELSTWPQQWVEATTGFNKGFERRVFDLDENRPNDPLFPFTAGSFGSGANMAFDVDWLTTSGGFDSALGTGTVAKGGDDLRAFYDVVRSGRQLAYVPSAIIFHHHHRTSDAIERQAYGYGAGLTAYLASVAIDDPTTILSMVRQMPRAIRHAASTSSPNNGDSFPGQARRTRQQRAGMLAGGFRYLKSRKHA